LFSKLEKLEKIKKILPKNIKFYDEDSIDKKLKSLEKYNIWLDNLSCSIYFKNLLKKKNRVVERIDPIYFFKSIKNPTEIKNTKKTHIIDGAALTKFLF